MVIGKTSVRSSKGGVGVWTTRKPNLVEGEAGVWVEQVDLLKLSGG